MERPVFVIGSVMAICSVLVSVAWLMSLATCFDELPSRASSYLLSIIARLVLRLVAHLVGRLVVPALPLMCFSCVFCLIPQGIVIA